MGPGPELVPPTSSCLHISSIFAQTRGWGRVSGFIFLLCRILFYIFYHQLGNKLYYEIFFLRKKERFLERVLWSKVFHGSEWVRVPNIDLGVAEGGVWSNLGVFGPPGSVAGDPTWLHPQLSEGEEPLV